MTPVDSPRVLLTRAADLIEERAATAGVWPRELKIPKAMLDGTAKRWGRDPDEMVNEILWIITVPPAVAPHLVAWLRAASSNYAANADWYPERSPERLAAMADPMARYALRFARLDALAALEVAEAAVHDAAFYAWMSQRADFTPGQAARLIHDLRRHRTDQEDN